MSRLLLNQKYYWFLYKNGASSPVLRQNNPVRCLWRCAIQLIPFNTNVKNQRSWRKSLGNRPILASFSIHFQSSFLTNSLELSPSRSRVLQLLKNTAAFYESRNSITEFTAVLHWSLSWARQIQSKPPHPIPSSSIPIQSTHIIFVFIVVSLFLTFLPITYMHDSSPRFLLHALPSYPPSLRHQNYTRRCVQVTKIPVMPLSRTSYISPWSKCSPDHLVLKYSQSIFLL
jgi:hypothetical protein